MVRSILGKRKKIGEIPGKPVFLGTQKEEKTIINLIAYDETEFIEIELFDINDILLYKKKYKNVWVNIDGLHNVEILQKIGLLFNIHTLIIEDIAHTRQRPKIEVEDDTIFTIIKMMSLEKDKKQLLTEQVSMFLSENILLTFQEQQGDIFDPIRNRLRNKKGRIRNNSIIYLKYCLLDSIISNYIFLIDFFGIRVEELEEKILLQPSNDTLEEINNNKIEFNYLRKNIRPIKEAVMNFKGLKTNLITRKEQPFFNDLNDLTQRAYDTVENYKNMLNEQLMMYSTNVNTRLNDIMKLLTIFSAIFIPITFIVGIYGTNFEYIPELKYKNGYYIMWGVILTTVITMLFYFKYKKWF